MKGTATTIGTIAAAIALGLVGWWWLTPVDREIKSIVPDAPATPGKTGYKRVDAILDKLRAAAQAAGIALGLMVGWIAKESGGKLAEKPQPGPGDTKYDERGYFQLMPDESKKLGLDHERLSTDSDYSIDAGVKLIKEYEGVVDALDVAQAGTSYYWKLVKLVHSMGAGQVKKIVFDAKDSGEADTWDDLRAHALGMSLRGPQPKKWFPFVDAVYAVGAPFGFGTEQSAVAGAPAKKKAEPAQQSARYGIDVFVARRAA